MDWLQSLLWDPSSVAHIVFLYAFVVAAGVYLGKIKIFGVSLGVTFVLFAGILMGHFGFTADTHILHFIREFGLILSYSVSVFRWGRLSSLLSKRGE